MGKKSAGIILFRKKNDFLEVMLVHPGGPFWAKKDIGVWSIPKGEFDDDEDALVAARREFEEELGKKFDPNKKRYGSKQVTSHIHGYKLKDKEDNEDEITNQSQVSIKLSENCLENDN